MIKGPDFVRPVYTQAETVHSIAPPEDKVRTGVVKTGTEHDRWSGLRTGAVFAAGFLASQAFFYGMHLIHPDTPTDPIPYGESGTYTATGACPNEMNLVVNASETALNTKHFGIGLKSIALICENKDGATIGLSDLYDGTPVSVPQRVRSGIAHSFNISIAYRYTGQPPMLEVDQTSSNENAPQSIDMYFNGDTFKVTDMDITPR